MPNGTCDRPIYGIEGQGAVVVSAVGERASHDLGCVIPGMGVTSGGAGLYMNSQPVAGTKPFVTPGSSVGTSNITGALRGRLGTSGVPLPTVVGGPGTGRALAVSYTTDVGAFVGRAAPFVGMAGIVIGSVHTYNCLSQ